MSDLTNLFAQRKKPSPPSIKRLFADQSKDKRYNKTRSNEPHKSIRKYHQHANRFTTVFTSKDFTKRYIQKDDIKKEILHYNQQILLAFIRKNFFVMSAVILFNILFTSSQQILILSNMMLSIVFMKIQLGKDLFTNFYFLVSKELIKIIIYSLNFYLLFSQIRPTIEERMNVEIILLCLNGCLNYLIQSFYRPLIVVQGIGNIKKPYQNIFQQLKQLSFKIIKSFKTIYHLRKPIVILNLIYWLLVLFYIMYKQSEILLNNLINLQTVFSITIATLLLHVFIQVIEKINQIIIIQLFFPSQKTLSMTLLRLDCGDKNNDKIANQAVKYICQNCEIFWDIDLLRHNYTINYDVIDDYLNLQLNKINQFLLTSINKLNNIAAARLLKKKWAIHWISALNQIIEIYSIASLLQRKQYLFYVIEHIMYFQSFSDQFPINTKIINRKLNKINELMIHILQKLTISKLKNNMNVFYAYLNNMVQSYQ